LKISASIADSPEASGAINARRERRVGDDTTR
jgi:hypothetical protein